MFQGRIIDTKLRKLSIQDAEKFIASSDFGASIFFSGTVRNQNDNKSVIGITYDTHDALVIQSFEEIYNEANEKLEIKNKAVFIDHAKGYLNLGEISIIIAVATKHREEAYKLSRYIIVLSNAFMPGSFFTYCNKNSSYTLSLCQSANFLLFLINHSANLSGSKYSFRIQLLPNFTKPS